MSNLVLQELMTMLLERLKANAPLLSNSFIGAQNVYQSVGFPTESVSLMFVDVLKVAL